MTNQIPNIILRLAPLLLITTCVVLFACASSDPSTTPTRAQTQQVLPGRSSQGTGAPGALADSGWAIVLAAYSGPDARAQAVAAADSIRTRTDLPSVRVQDRGRGAAVVAGSYRTPSDASAQRDLARTRELSLDGRAPFASAFLAPPIGAPDPGATPQYHLSRATTEFGAQSKYTLQIAVYESSNPAEARRAAEQAAVQLRAEGEPAFYYHGPSRSMVTLGAFTAKEAGLENGLPSPILTEYQRRHPLNLFNGRELLQRTTGQAKALPQSSFLVEIPHE